MTDHLIVSEIFGPTVQGEGPSAGRRCGFLRLGLCNLNCSWCDTAYTWDFKGQNGTAYDRHRELHSMTEDEVLEAIEALGVDRLVISGGEPFVQHKALTPLLWHLPPTMWIEVETNGTHAPEAPLKRVDQLNISPKLAHSGVPATLAIDVPTLRSLGHHPGAVFKFVVQTEADLDEVSAIVDLVNIRPGQVWIMPEGRDVKTLTKLARRDALETAIERGYNVTGRLQIELWGSSRGH